MTATIAEPTTTAAPKRVKARRARVTYVSIDDLPDGRRRLRVKVVTAAGEELRLQVHGDVFVPLTDNPEDMSSLVLEFVPRRAPDAVRRGERVA